MLNLTRTFKCDDGWFGELSIDGAHCCLTLERDDTFIKPGEYDIKPFSSQKHPDTYEIIIPGHTAVLFHAGNTEDDSKGCILLGIGTGEVKGKRAIISSKDAVRKFKLKMCRRNADKIIIEEETP